VTRRWLDRHWRDLLIVAVGLAVVLRVLLIINAPAYGYVWDFYQEGVARLYAQGHLPLSTDCWQCYHPPLFYWLGWPFYAIGVRIAPGNDDLAWRLLAGEALLAVAVLVYYGVRLLRLIGCRGASLAAGVALLLMTPILFISSDAPDADTLVAALLSGFAFHATRIFGGRRVISTGDAAGLGVLIGLAMATKFSGLIALGTAGVLILVRLFEQRDRGATLRAGAIVVLLSLAIGGWKYVDNLRRYGTPLFANGSAAEGFTAGATRESGAYYEFLTIRLGALRTLFGREAPAGQLTDFPVYRSVITTLHAQAWSDMSLFSVRTRHGAPGNPYRTRRISVALSMGVIVLGFVPEALAVLGVVVSARRRITRPLLVFGLITIAAYVWWFLPQERWALKGKYLLALLPIGVVFTMVGQAWLSRRLPRLAAVMTTLLVALGVVAHLYMLVFAAAR
jgi:4-amino-4-deoxy-L-arabinose transferase-like glycosyltransferase